MPGGALGALHTHSDFPGRPPAGCGSVVKRGPPPPAEPRAGAPDPWCHPSVLCVLGKALNLSVLSFVSRGC